MPEGQEDHGVDVVRTRQQPGAGTSRASSATQVRRRMAARKSVQRQPPPAPQRQDVIDLTDDRQEDDDDLVQITHVKINKRPRLRAPTPGGPEAVAQVLVAGAVPPQPGLAAAPGLPMLQQLESPALQQLLANPQLLAAAAAAAAAAAPPVAAAPPAPPPAPPSPKGYKCTICLERMEADLATTTCGHMFCFKCISSWVQKSGNCPQCRSKLTRTKIIRIYPPS